LAIFRFSLKTGSRAQGKSGAAHASYIQRTERYDYGAHELKYTESGNMPEWATSPGHFWAAADFHERLNAEIYREFEISLPRELTLEQQVRLIREFTHSELRERHPYTLAIHEVPAMDGGTNPHAHVMFTTRTMDGLRRPEEQFFKRANAQHPEKGGAIKDRSWKPKERLYELRESWQDQCNLALKRAGHDAQIDARSLKDQGIDRNPEPKLTPYEAMLWKQGVLSEKVEAILILREIAALQHQQEANAKHLATLKEMANLEDFRARVGETLADQRQCLESHLSERERLDRRIQKLDMTLDLAPGSQADAYEMARDLMFKSALDAHVETIHRLQNERNQLSEGIGTGGIVGFFKDAPNRIAELGDAFETQRSLEEARRAYRALVTEMHSPEAKQDYELFGQQLYRNKLETEIERNALVEDALSVRADIQEYESLIPKTEAMLRTVQAEIEEAAQRLSPALRTWIRPEESQIQVGQVTNNTLENPQASQTQPQQMTLKLSLKLSLENEVSS
jgi:hypothetical protein